MAYQPIENYGIIGDLHSVALVGMDGSIDWLCLPSFDSPSVFAAILDDEKGGRFKIAPTSENVSPKQLYWPDTNVLITRFFTPEGVAEVTDYMPVHVSENGRGGHQLIRRIKVVRGEMNFQMECSPAFDYARDDHKTEITAGGAFFRSGQVSLGLATDVPLRAEGNRAVAEFNLREEQMAVFVLRQIEAGADRGFSLSEREEEEIFMQTVEYWRRWLSQCTYTGRWREMVQRSALTLKLLTYEPTGAIVAAPTTSLPEGIGGERNWDYRYTWIRDAAFTLYGLLRIGFTEEAAGFMGWLEDRCSIEFGMLQAIAEGVDLLERYHDRLDIAEVLRCWRHGSVIRSWLVDLMEEAYRADGGTEEIPAYVEDTGEVNWLVDDALHMEVPVPVISQLFASRDDRKNWARAIAMMRHGFGGHPYGPSEAEVRERREGASGASCASTPKRPVAERSLCGY